MGIAFGILSEGGKYHLVEIQPVTKENQYGQECHRRIIPFSAPAHEDQDGANKVDDKIQEENALESITMFMVANPVFKINSFFRLVAIPDQHVLGEPEIGPEDGKRKHELANIVQVLLVYQFQVTQVLQIDYKDCD